MSCRLVGKEASLWIPLENLPLGKLGITGAGAIIVRDNLNSSHFTILGENNGYSHPSTVKIRVLEEGEQIEVRYS